MAATRVPRQRTKSGVWPIEVRAAVNLDLSRGDLNLTEIAERNKVSLGQVSKYARRSGFGPFRTGAAAHRRKS